jgi:ankyrin repeat protein
LHDATASGNITIVSLLLDHGAGIDTQDMYGRTALHYAAEHGHVKLVSFLLDHKASMNTRDMHGLTALQYAVFTGKEEVVSILIARGANLETKDKYGGTALTAAIEHEHEAIVKLLLDQGVIVNHQLYARITYNKSFETGQKRAIKIWEARRSLCQYHSDSRHSTRSKSSWKNFRKCTPMWLATEIGNQKIERLLLASGAKLDCSYRAGSTRTICEETNSRIYGTCNPILCAANNRNWVLVYCLLESGENITDTDAHGNDVLSIAVREGMVESVTRCLETDKFDAEKRDENGRTRFSYAYHRDVVASFLASGKIDPNSRDITGRTTISHIAGGSSRVPYQPSRDGLTSAESVLRVLIASDKVDIDIKDNKQRTPLSHAAEKNQVTSIKLLLGTGKVDVDSRDINGRTPLSYCSPQTMAILQAYAAGIKVDPTFRHRKLIQGRKHSRLGEHGHDSRHLA